MTQTDLANEQTFVAEDGRILLFSCDRFVADVCQGNACFVCGVFPDAAKFNGEHIVPRWVLRRFGLFDKEITLPSGERRKYGGYKVPCCVECNSLLGREIETPVSALLDGDASAVLPRLDGQGRSLLFKWLVLLFLKIHLKDNSVPIHRDHRKGVGVIGDVYDWPDLHHLHAVARSPYTRASLFHSVIGSLQVFEIVDGVVGEDYDYVDFTFSQTIALRLGSIGIVCVLNDSGAAEIAWSGKLSIIDGPISTLQLREIAARFAVANSDLISRPTFGTLVSEGKHSLIYAQTPAKIELPDFDPKKFGEALAFAVRDRVAAGAIEVDGTRDQKAVHAAICTGRVQFLADEDGKFRPEVVKKFSV
jgi:hypothetical protein